MNETTELIMKQLNSKKVHAETHELGGGDEIDVLKLKNIDNFVTKSGDFAGTWNGVEMTSTEPGLSSAFNALKTDTTQRGLNISSAPYNALGNGTDETAKIQAAINDLLPNQRLIGDPSKTYLVSQLLINKSNVILDGLNLKMIAGFNRWDAVVKVIGTRESPTRNIKLLNLNIDGNRTNQTGILVNNPDESRPGISINAVVSDVLIENCVSNYNAGDGIWIYSRIANGEVTGTARTTDDAPCCTNIKVRNCVFNYNRRHGGALDSLKGALFEDCVFSYNGTDINGGVTDGDKGETYNGYHHGNGFDLEGYGQGTAYTNIVFLRCDFSANASRSLSVYEGGSDLTYTPFVQRGNILFQRCTFDGLDTEGYSFYVSPTTANKSRSPFVFRDIDIVDCEFITGKVLIQGVDRGYIANNYFGVVGAASFTLDYASNIKMHNQVNVDSTNVFRGANATDIRLMMVNNNMTRPIITAGSFASLPTTNITDGTLALIQSPTSSSSYAYIRHSGAWRVFAQQIGSVSVVGTAPAGTLNKSIPVRNDDGTILGYIPIYS